MTGAPIPARLRRRASGGARWPPMATDDQTTSARSPPSPRASTSGGAAKTSSRGTTVLAAGRSLRPQDLGVLSSIGMGEAMVVRRPRVRLIITGNELLPSGSPPSGVRIADANGPMLAALVERDGGIVDFPGLVPDEHDAILEALHAEADVVIVSGGSSVGIEDMAPMLLARHGELAIHGIAMRPSSPTGLGRLGTNAGLSAARQSGVEPVRLRLLRRPRDSSARRPAAAVAVPLRRADAAAEDQFADRPPRLRACPDRGRRWSNRWRSAAPRCSRRRRGPTASSSSATTARASPPAPRSRCGAMREQEQFLQVLDRDEAERRFRAALDLTPRGVERVPLDAGAGPRAGGGRRVARRRAVVRPLERRRLRRRRRRHVRRIRRSASPRAPGRRRRFTPASCPRPSSALATPSSSPPAAWCRAAPTPSSWSSTPTWRDDELRIGRAVTAGSGISFAGTDITAGETVLRRGELLTSRDTGVLAAIGVADGRGLAPAERRHPLDRRRDHLAGEPMRPARVYDSNAQVLADAVRELGGEPRSSRHRPRRRRRAASSAARGAGRRRRRAALRRHQQGRRRRVLSCRRRARPIPGIVAHGVALKPGKPICLAATGPATGRRAAGLSDVGDLHLPRVRRARHCACWPAAAPTRDRSCRRGSP